MFNPPFGNLHLFRVSYSTKFSIIRRTHITEWLVGLFNNVDCTRTPPHINCYYYFDFHEKGGSRVQQQHSGYITLIHQYSNSKAATSDLCELFFHDYLFYDHGNRKSLKQFDRRIHSTISSTCCRKQEAQ